MLCDFAHYALHATFPAAAPYSLLALKACKSYKIYGISLWHAFCINSGLDVPDEMFKLFFHGNNNFVAQKD
jgi:hypothetical protein